jgi:hypothetical protein
MGIGFGGSVVSDVSNGTGCCGETHTDRTVPYTIVLLYNRQYVYCMYTVS